MRRHVDRCDVSVTDGGECFDAKKECSPNGILERLAFDVGYNRVRATEQVQAGEDHVDAEENGNDDAEERREAQVKQPVERVDAREASEPFAAHVEASVFVDEAFQAGFGGDAANAKVVDLVALGAGGCRFGFVA